MALIRAGAAERIAVTLGPDGAFLASAAGAVHMPAIAGPVLSAVGAGDTFLAAMVLSLSRGESVALMNDQKFNGGVAAPLFGVTAYTAPGPSSFALRFGIPLQPMSVQRGHKARFKVVVHDPITLVDTGDRNADIRTGVDRVNAFIEERVRARPAEWFWVHKRWPNELYKRRPESGPPAG